jgi:retron-type reverse transcriptase
MLCISSAMASYISLKIHGVHQGSPISPALFNIYMEAVMTEVLRRCSRFQILYKLYADDVIITVSHQHLEHFLVILHNVSDDFDLIINPKYNISAAKKYRKIHETRDLKGIPVV